jgi:hypothetical protein
MVGIASPLECVIEIRSQIESGQSLRSTIERYCQNHHDDFSEDLKVWYLETERGLNLQKKPGRPLTSYRKAIFDILAQGLRGQAILSQLKDIEEEIWTIVQLDIEKFVSLLPIRALIPLMLFQLPGFLILLLGPILQKLLVELSR